jgi:transcriptional regulator with XRE-family HTH domain
MLLAMGIRPRKPPRGHLFLKEHRNAKKISATKMAEMLGIERESVYRLERQPWRVNSAKQADWAQALGIEPEELWRPPGAVSLDALVRTAPDDVKAMAADIVQRIVKGER